MQCRSDEGRCDKSGHPFTLGPFFSMPPKVPRRNSTSSSSRNICKEFFLSSFLFLHIESRYCHRHPVHLPHPFWRDPSRASTAQSHPSIVSLTGQIAWWVQQQKKYLKFHSHRLPYRRRTTRRLPKPKTKPAFFLLTTNPPSSI